MRQPTALTDRRTEAHHPSQGNGNRTQFPYLHSGKPLLATDIKTHNQILTRREAWLAAANPRDFAEGMLRLAADPGLRRQLGENGRTFVEAGHTYAAHQKRLADAYDWIDDEIQNEGVRKGIGPTPGEDATDCSDTSNTSA